MERSEIKKILEKHGLQDWGAIEGQFENCIDAVLEIISIKDHEIADLVKLQQETQKAFEESCNKVIDLSSCLTSIQSEINTVLNK